MSDYVTSAGLETKTIQTILDELSTQQKLDISNTLNTDPDEPLGQMNGIFAAQVRELWEVLLVVFNAMNPDAAEGALLDALCAITGTLRPAATYSRVALDIDIDAGVTLVSGTHYANVIGDPDNTWTPEADFTSPSSGVHSVTFRADNAGAVVATANTITDITTLVVGWNSANNPLDAVVGSEADTDAQLRIRRESELRASGSATVDAIRADVLLDPAVQQCSVFENDDDTPDPVTGLPPKSFEVVVYDGSPAALTNDAVAQLIWDSKPAGIRSFGTAVGVATDSTGYLHSIYFSRPQEVEIWIDLAISVDQSSGYEGAEALKAALVALNGTDLKQGRDVITARLEAVAMSFEGVFDITTPVAVGLTASPVSTSNVSIGQREIARLDTSRITITETFTSIP